VLFHLFIIPPSLKEFSLNSTLLMYSTSWELPELVSGTCTMVSDADGKHYPWYGANNEVMKVRGPTHLPTPITVSMRDTFCPQV